MAERVAPSIGASCLNFPVPTRPRSVPKLGGRNGAIILLRGGFGVNVRTSETFSIQPELTVVRSVDPSDGSPILFFPGVGFSFDNLPDFSDVPLE
jgi:hypothetical protein